MDSDERLGEDRRSSMSKRDCERKVLTEEGFVVD